MKRIILLYLIFISVSAFCGIQINADTDTVKNDIVQTEDNGFFNIQPIINYITPEPLQVKNNRAIFLFAIFFMLSVYHINMYIMHISDRSLFSFSLLNLCIGFYYFFQNYSSIDRMNSLLHPERLYILSSLFIFVLMYLSLFYAVEKKQNFIIRRIIYLLVIIETVCVLFVPIGSLFSAYLFFKLITIIIVLIGLSAFIKKGSKNKLQVKTVEAAFFIYISASVFFHLPVLQVIRHNTLLAAHLFLVFSLIHLLVQKYIISYDHEKQLQAELGEKTIHLEKANRELSQLNKDLESNVAVRTNEYKSALRSVEATLHELEKAHQKIEHDLNMSSNVQRIYFSENIPRVKDWETAFIYRPMQKVSGDMYDLYVNNGTLIGMSLFDVSGHGVQSALITMLAKNIISELFYKLYDKPAGYILEIINKRLIEEIGIMDNYMTGILVKVKDNILEVANASHANILHRIDKEDRVRQLKPKNGNGNFIGIQLMDEPYPTDVYVINDEDSILLYTDGIYEHNMLENTVAAAHEKLITTFEKCRRYQSANSQLDYILQGFNLDNPEKRLEDDLTLVLLKKTVKM